MFVKEQQFHTEIYAFNFVHNPDHTAYMNDYSNHVLSLFYLDDKTKGKNPTELHWKRAILLYNEHKLRETQGWTFLTWDSK